MRASETTTSMPTPLFTKLAVAIGLLFLTGCVGKTTDISEEGFHLILPGQWSGGYDGTSGTWVYLTPSGEEGVAIGVLPQPPGTYSTNPVQNLDAYLRLRRRQEQELTDETMVLTDPVVRKTRAETIATYDGVGAMSRRRTRTMIIVNEITAVGVRYEAFGMSEKGFASRAQAVLERASLEE